MPDEGPYRPVYFDLHDKSALPLAQVIQDLAQAIADTLKIPAPDLGDDPETAFRQTWLPSALDDLPDDSCLVLLFDEFDVLADASQEQAAESFFPYLRDLLNSGLAKLKFVFVIGRNVNDLSNIALSLFKGTDSQQVSLLNRNDTEALIRLSEDNDSLHWSDESVEEVWQLTQGHPFLIQQLCSHVWEEAYDEEPDAAPTVEQEDVDEVVEDALEASRNTLEWLWNGLPPAARVVSSALAEAGRVAIDQERLEELLHDSGVRVVIRDLQNAPRQLEDWDILESTEDGFRFRVELLRQWIAAYKPLQRVQEDLDRIEPVAQNLYEAARGLYQGGQLEQAIPLLEQALGLNPNHLAANQLLADLYLSQEELDKAQLLLERLNEYQPGVARPRFVQVLLLQARRIESEEEKLDLYERALALDSNQSEAQAEKRRIWEQRGNEAQESGDFDIALEAYRKAGLKEKVAESEKAIRHQQFAEKKRELEQYEQAEQFNQALTLAQDLAEQYPDEEDWPVYQDMLREQIELADLYQRAMGAVQSEDQRQIRSLLAKVIARDPSYKEAARYLYQSVSGVDVEELQRSLKSLRKRFGDTQIFQLPGGAELKMVWIEPGTFLMGSPESEKGRDYYEGPQHEAIISQGFWLGQHVITQGQWEKVMQTKPWDGKDYVKSNPDNPAVYISWEDVQQFIEKLNKSEGNEVYRLPTEAEWEYACRAGTETRWAFGGDGSKLGDYAWYRANAWEKNEKYAHAVGTRLANPWGVYDMHGNVWEWCQDYHGSYFKDTQIDPIGPETDFVRVMRGGSFFYPAHYSRSANRDRNVPGFRGYSIGVRLLRIFL